MSKVYDAFGKVPANIAPSIPVRYWNHAFLLAILCFAVLYPLVLWLTWLVPGTLPSYKLALWEGMVLAMHLVSLGQSYTQESRYLIEGIQNPVPVLIRVGLAFLVAIGASVALFISQLKPRSNTWHLKGPQLLEGKEALVECKRRSLTPLEALDDPHCLRLHPALLLPKKHWSRHTIVYGAVAGGKTQVLFGILQQIIDKDQKVFIYDIKGDFTAKFRQPIIVSPFDSRSYVWDIAKDVRTPTQAAAFAASLIPEEQGSGRFWTLAAQQIVTGAVRSLQNEHGIDWDWMMLASRTSLTAEEMLPILEANYAKAVPLISNIESQATASILATVSSFTRVIDDLALAWPKIGSRRFSITEWVKDDYKGRKQVIVQSGGDSNLTRAYISAMVNVAVPDIISPSLPDNESGRFLGFLLDELPSLGRINLPPLIDKGRSKGVVCLLGLQSLEQLKQVYGDNEAKALASMVGTHIICQIQMGETRDALAQQLGRRKVAWRTHDANAQVHEESKALVSSGELTDELGYRKGKSYGPHGWGIRALVQMGGDLLLLNFPGIQLPDKRKGQEPALWTTRPAKSKSQRTGGVTEPVPYVEHSAKPKQQMGTIEAVRKRGLSDEDIDSMFQDH